MFLEREKSFHGSEPRLDSDLWRAVEELPVTYRQAIVLRFCRDLSFQQIGKKMGKSEGAAKMILYRALKRLRKRVVKEHE